MIIMHRVRVDDTDFYDAFHHLKQGVAMENDRDDLLRMVGYRHEEQKARGKALPVMSFNCDYKKDMQIGGVFYVKTRIKKSTRVKIVFEQTILTESHDAVSVAEVTMAYLDRETRRPEALPDEILANIEKYQAVHAVAA